MDPIAKGDLAGWTPDSRKVYLDRAKKLLSEGWELVKTSELTERYNSFGYCHPEPGAIFTWVIFIHRAEMRCFSIWQFGPQAKGAPGTVHGGIVCTAVDKTIGNHIIHGQNVFPVVTTNLALDFHRPVPLESPTIIEGKIDKVEGKKYHVKFTMKNPDGTTTYSTAKATFIHIPIHKFGAKSNL